jgi:glucosamine--fructose-6-phosphate aminotransferase (isomerizing)
MGVPILGQRFELEIREQPAVWRHIASSDRAERLARGIEGKVVLVGSGSSLCVAQLGALALRRRSVDAVALAATEARLDRHAYEGAVVVAISQSGRSSDLLDAIALLRPRRLIALTNTVDSPLAGAADVTIDIGAGAERAVPASKSVSATAAILLWAASVVGQDGRRDAPSLQRAADAVEDWLLTGNLADLDLAARRIGSSRSVVVLGSDYGLPIANEMALKMKEACYVHAEGFAAGEFRHGSVAMVDGSTAVIGIVDDDALDIVARPLREVARAQPLRYTIGTPTIDDIPRAGPSIEAPFNTLAWLVTVQMIALFAARARGIESDSPRGLMKALVWNP